mgnify:CR=1 FL=1
MRWNACSKSTKTACSTSGQDTRFTRTTGFFARAERALAPFSNVVLILPSPDLEESLCLLQKVPRNRQLAKEHPDLHEKLQRHLVTHHSNHDLAKHVVYTHGKSPEQSRDELLEAVSAT